MLFNSLTFVVFFAVVVARIGACAVGGAQKSARRRELHFLRRVESAFRRASLRHDRDGFLSRPSNGQSAKTGMPRKVWLVVSVAVNLSMLGFFKYGNFLLENFQWVLARERHHLPTAASRYLSADRHFVLHLPFALLHARHLSRRDAADAIAARFRARGFVFPAARRRTDRARGRFSCRNWCTARAAARPFLLGTCCS